MALLLARGGTDGGTPIGFAMNGAAAAPGPVWPHAAEFVRWLLSDESELALRRFRWTRAQTGTNGASR